MPKENVIQLNKKTLRNDILNQLEQSLSKLKDHLGEDQFKSRLKKAVKILTEDMDADEPEKKADIKPKEQDAKATPASKKAKKSGDTKTSDKVVKPAKATPSDKVLKSAVKKSKTDKPAKTKAVYKTKK